MTLEHQHPVHTVTLVTAGILPILPLITVTGLTLFWVHAVCWTVTVRFVVLYLDVLGLVAALSLAAHSTHAVLSFPSHPRLLGRLEQLLCLGKAPPEGGIHGLRAGKVGVLLAVSVLVEKGPAVIYPVIISATEELNGKFPILMFNLASEMLIEQLRVEPDDNVLPSQCYPARWLDEVPELATTSRLPT